MTSLHLFLVILLMRVAHFFGYFYLNYYIWHL